MCKKILLSAILSATLFAANNYKLNPVKISDTVYQFEGVKEVPSKDNGGNMVNTYWVKGQTSWIVVDSGPSYKYAQAAYEKMQKIANLPVKYVINTHRHEDHWLGNNYYKEKFGAKIYATKAQVSQYPVGIVPNYAHVISKEDYEGTKVIAVDELVTKDFIAKFDGREFQIKHFDYAVHTPEDIMVYMPDEKVLLAGDILFSERIPRITDGSVEGGLKSLEVVESYDVKVYATGHGKYTDDTAIHQMREYFTALKETALQAIEEGKDLTSYVNSADFSDFKDRYMMEDLHKGNLSHAFREYEFY
ncbi:MAG: MBL fold metallo-hydrolase [Campylobacterales bacterium]|nr:MBL fold metallo-hydrolase [Campylobacterales bacterium]